MWGSWVHDEDKKYYASAVAVIEGKDPESFISELEGDEGKINPNWFISNVGVIYEANQVGNDAVKEYNEKGIEPDMDLNSKKVGQEKINMTAASDYKRRADQELMDGIFDLVIKRVEEKKKRKLPKIKGDEQEPQEQPKEEEKNKKKGEHEQKQPKKNEKQRPNQEVKVKEEELPNQDVKTQEKDKHEQGDEIPTQNEGKHKKQEEPKKDNNQKQPAEHHHCHDCCSHDNPNPLPEDPKKLKQELDKRNEHILSELKQKSLEKLLQSFGSELQVFKSKYTFYRYKDTPNLHTENCTKLSNYLTSNKMDNFVTLIEELNIDTSSQQ